jgi:hypothetical protein
MALGIPIIGDIIDAVKELGSELIADPDKKRELNVELEKLRDAGNARAHAEVLAQIEVNKVEAASGSLFVAGWRPAVGWVCAAGLAVQTMILPTITAFTGKMFNFDTELLILTMSGMLGIGAMRTYEKVKGVSTNDYTDVPRTTVAGAQAAAKNVLFGPRKEVVQPLSAVSALPEDAPWSK